MKISYVVYHFERYSYCSGWEEESFETYEAAIAFAKKCEWSYQIVKRIEETIQETKGGER